MNWIDTPIHIEFWECPICHKRHDTYLECVDCIERHHNEPPHPGWHGTETPDVRLDKEGGV